MTDLDPKPEATTSEERSARRLALGIAENPSTETTITFLGPNAAAAMRRQLDRVGEQAPADDVEPPDEAA